MDTSALVNDARTGFIELEDDAAQVAREGGIANVTQRFPKSYNS